MNIHTYTSDVCIYVYLYIYLYLHMYTYINVYIHVCTYKHMCLYIFIATYMFEYSHQHIFLHAHRYGETQGVLALEHMVRLALDVVRSRCAAVLAVQQQEDLASVRAQLAAAHAQRVLEQQVQTLESQLAIHPMYHRTDSRADFRDFSCWSGSSARWHILECPKFSLVSLLDSVWNKMSAELTFENFWSGSGARRHARLCILCTQTSTSCCVRYTFSKVSHLSHFIYRIY